MMNVAKRKCTHHSCTEKPIYGVAGTNTVEFCSAYAQDGMMVRVYT